MAGPDGYQVGNAWVQVLPSFRNFHRRMAAQLAKVGDVDIPAQLDLNTKNAEAAAKAAESRLVKHPIKLKSELDNRALQAQLAKILATKDAKVIKLDLDVSALKQKIQDLNRNREDLKIDVDAEIAKYEAKIHAIEAQRHQVVVQADADTANAERKLAQLDEHTTRIGNNQTDINMEAGDASRAVAILGALVAGLGAVTYAAPAAAAALAAIPHALAAGAQAIGTVSAGFHGISDAVGALQTVEDQAASTADKNSAKRVSAANRIADAQAALGSALAGADHAAIVGARQVQDARESLAGAQIDAASRVQDAERGLQAAQQSARDAQLALNDARKEAKERLEDLRISVVGAALDEESAALSVDKAREKLQAAQKAGVKGRDLQEIDLAFRQAQQRLNEVRERYRDLKTESVQANKAGVSGSAEVVAAQRVVQEATGRVLLAEQELARTRTDGARRVAQAQQNVARAQQDASYAATQASRSIADAQRGIAQASVATGSQGSAAMDKLNAAMAKLSPQGRAFAHFLQDQVKPALEDMGSAASTTMLPKVQRALQQLLILQPMVNAALMDTGSVIGDLAIKGAEMVSSGPWRKDFVTIADRNNRMLAAGGDAGLHMLDAMRNITVASGPLIEGMVNSAAAAADHFATWIQGKRDSGELQAWFHEMSARIRELWELVKDFAGGVFDVLQALAPLGHAILEIVAPLAELIGNFAEANPVLTTIIGLAVLLGSSFVSFFRTLGGLAQAWRTSRGVFDSLIFGQRNAAKATDEATDAAAKNTTATGKWRDAISGTTGLIGRTSEGLRKIRDGYTTGATAAGNWATRIGTTAATGIANFNSAIFGTSQKLLEQERAYGRLSGAAVTTFSTVSRVAGGATVAIGRGLTGAVSGLVGALGGPWGIAIAAATVGLGFLVSAQANAAQKAAEHKAQIQTLTDALVESNGVIDEHIIKLINQGLEEGGTAERARHFGLDVGRMSRAIAEGGATARVFESDLRGLGTQIATDAGLPASYGDNVNDLVGQFLNGGISADDFKDKLQDAALEMIRNKDLTDEQKEALWQQLLALGGLVTGYGGATGTFKSAREGQKNLEDAQNSAATATERHARALRDLNQAALESVNKALAYRTSLTDLKDAQSRVTQAEKEHGVQSQQAIQARQQEEQAILRVVAAAGELAFANSKAKTEEEKKLAADQAMIDAAIRLANNYSGPLPKALQQYLTSIGAVKDETGKWIALVRNAPSNFTINVNFNDKLARKRLDDWEKRGLTGYLLSGAVTKKPSGGRIFAKADGGILTAYANGGMRPMSGAQATVVPPNSFRLIGDRMVGDEAFIPLDKSSRSQAILAEAAARMGFLLMPMLRGGLLAMQDGGVAAAGGNAAPAQTGAAALTLEPATVDAFTASLQALVASGLAPLAAEVTTTTAPALTNLELHVGNLSTAAITRLMETLTQLQMRFNQTATVISQAWQRIAASSNANLAAVRGYLGALRTGLSATQTAMTQTANAAQSQFARVKPAAADPIRWVLANPINAGLIAAWGRLNVDFAMKKPVRPVPIPFAFGGRVPGFGDRDIVDAKLTPGEYVFSKPAIANLGGVANVDRMHRLARAGVVGPAARLGTKGDALERLKLMRTVPLDGLGFAYGGVQPHVARAGQEIEQKFGPLPGGIGGVGSRPNVSDHPLGLALDFMTMSNTALGDRIASYLQANSARLLVKYLIWKQRINDGAAWKLMEDRGSITANHFDHVHTSFLRLGQKGRKFTGAGILDPTTYFAKAFKQLAQVPNLFPGNKAGQAAADLAYQAVVGAIRFAEDKIGSAQVAGSPQVVAAVRAVANRFGWGSGLEWDSLSRLISGESGWDPKAANPSSSARGLFQKLTAVHGPVEPTAVGQAEWGLKYIKDAYGSPSNAYRQWLSRSPHWYDDGGWLPPGYSTVYNGTGRPEPVLNAPQWNSLISLAGANSGGAFTGHLYLSSGEWLGHVDGRIDQANMNAGRALAYRTR